MKQVHAGLVCRDIDWAMVHLSELLGLHWVGGDRKEWSLTLYGEARRVPLRIAHASRGSGNYELIEAVPGTPWETQNDIVQHHICLHDSDSVAACLALEEQGYDRIMGRHGDPQGYFQAASGLLVEMIGDELLGYLEAFYERSRPMGGA